MFFKRRPLDVNVFKREMWMVLPPWNTKIEIKWNVKFCLIQRLSPVLVIWKWVRKCLRAGDGANKLWWGSTWFTFIAFLMAFGLLTYVLTAFHTNTSSYIGLYAYFYMRNKTTIRIMTYAKWHIRDMLRPCCDMTLYTYAKWHVREMPLKVIAKSDLIPLSKRIIKLYYYSQRNPRIPDSYAELNEEVSFNRAPRSFVSRWISIVYVYNFHFPVITVLYFNLFFFAFLFHLKCVFRRNGKLRKNNGLFIIQSRLLLTGHLPCHGYDEAPFFYFNIRLSFYNTLIFSQ